MDGILVINKPSGLTSRDVVNKISKLLNTKKVGHTGTLDPLATGVLVLCIGKATKLVDVITGTDKEYIASVKLGLLTDTLDVEGKVLEKRNCYVNKEELASVLKSFIGKYNQEVPIYSAVKINGKKLYEYARRNEKVNLPKREVEIKKIELLEFSNDSYSFKVTVSKGTYIRSLIKDINDKLGVIGVMDSLKRTRQGKFKIDNAYTLEDVLNNKHKLISIKDVLKDKNCVTIDDNLFDVIKHGGIINNIYKEDYVTFIHNDNVVSIYKTYDKDNTKMKPYKMFI
ncbi:MAG TPA: tRNA pseudouridine(55) synthase TruB [Candidatus Aphodocola excrementigallinarum]|uniref:tRNA pseudouridine synthase B n=1 Tax=Candidatus Aphodocola excrementigallinarum TaxID=2840670 RepID=A0A9D1IMH5_9FIRM|nr:tRNA pseudouridine(55) synthase TruB [Candidatus Aphodocola excrementigallinarum]